MVKHSPPLDANQKKVDERLDLTEVKSLKSHLEKEKKKADDYLNKLKYLQADFENYKKRVKKEINETIRYGNRRLILDLLTVLDELECAVDAGKQGSRKTLLDGVEITLKKLYNILEREGLSKIEALGNPFNPKKHEAVLRVQTSEEDGIILEEIRKGFMLNDLVIRPSLVKVAVNTSKKVKNDEQ